MKTLLAMLLACLLNSASANTYYFSAISGDDSRTSTQAQNSATPWKTLSKLNSFFSTLLPGDAVLLKRGETFYGSITVNKSGTVSAPIVIGAYGTGSRPVITSLVTLSGWTANSSYSGVYESAVNSALAAKVNMVLLNGVQKGIGRYPNANIADKGYLTFESHVGKTSITDNQLPASPNWTGAEVVIRTARWILDRCLITSHSGTKISYNALLTYDPKDNYGYFIQNHIKTLDQLGEWYYNPSTKKISMYFGGNNPSSYLIQAATTESLVYSATKSYVVFDNITFKGANGYGLDINGGTNNYVNNCDILFSGRDGVRATGTGFKLENSNILNSNNDGVNVNGGTKPIVRNNIIKNSYSIAGMGQSGNGNGAGVRINGGGLAEYNQIINSGYAGVMLGGDYTIVKNNFVDSFCFIKDDGAGIYVANGGATNIGRKITGNIVLNAIGAAAGGNSTGFSAEGIYFDDNANGVEVTGNTVANCNRGVLFHNSRDIIVKGNTFYNHINGQLAMKHDNLGGALRNHTITDNIFFSKLSTQIVASFTSITDDLASVGTLNNNYYARPMDNQITFYNNIHYLTPGQIINYRDLAGWKAKYGHDGASKISAKQIAPYKLKSLIGVNKFTNGTLNSSVQYIFPNSCVVSWGNAGLLDGGYLKVVPSAEKSSIVMSIGALTAGKKYILKYSLKGAGVMSLAANLRSASYVPNTPLIQRTVSTARTENEILFSPVTSETAGSLVFTSDAKIAYYLDNIQLYEVDATITNPDDSIRFVYNASNLDKTVTLNGSYVDVKNTRYSNTIVLPPYGSKILIKDGGTITTPVNENPTVSITSPAINASFTAPSTITISATAADADGSVIKVDFYNGSTLLGSDNTSPYTFTWSNVATGNYSLTAKATDNGSLVTASSAVNISLYTPNAAPTVIITTPVNSATFAAPASVTISATAADTDGSVSKVDFYNGTTLLGSDSTSPYTFTWNNVSAGSYSLTAKATDNGSLEATSSSVNVSVNTADGTPTVSITGPVNNDTFISPASITIIAAAADADGSVTKVDFYNGSALLGSDSTSPYTFTWNNVPAGAYTLTAKAYDNGGFVTTSAGVLISVTTQNAPTVSITNPLNNAQYAGPATINMSALASDADGTISKVEFYNGTTLLHTENTAPYLFTWNNVPAGAYTITAKAYDNSGFVTTSAGVSISVTTQNAPTVSITNPLNNANYTGLATIDMSAIASDSDGTITKVEFYNGTTLLVTERYAPYTYTWSNVPAGNYTITAKAYDNSGNITTSAGVLVSVNNSTPLIGNAVQNPISPAGNSDLAFAPGMQNPGNFTESVSIKVGPNPATNTISVFTTGLLKDKDLRIAVVSISGVVLKSINTTTSNRVVQVDISSLITGAYFMQIRSGDMIVNKQFVKR